MSEGKPRGPRGVLRTVVGLVVLAVVLNAVPSSDPFVGAGTIPISAASSLAADRLTLPPVTPTVPGLVAGLPGDGLAAYLTQRIAWADCGDGETQCAQILAPMDYGAPQLRAVTLALRKRPASAGPKLGSLFINPGGPGASGTDFVDQFRATGLSRYDIVGWDPRGTGSSTPVSCLTDQQSDRYLDTDLSPDTSAEREALIAANRGFAEACWERNGEYLAHIGTVDTVRDLDLLRQLVGDKKLNYFGYSYGTQIGATYAELFGKSSGRMVLDAAVDISPEQDSVQAVGFDQALGNFAQWCAAHSCQLGRTKAEVVRVITALFDRLDSHPLPVGNRQLTQSQAVSGVAMGLYGGLSSWPLLAVYLSQAIDGEGTGLLEAADQLNNRDSDGHYATMFSAFPAIRCLDTKEDGVRAADRRWAEDQRKAPVFGKYFGPDYGCSFWPVPPSSYLDLNIHGKDAAPLVVIGATGDSATPYQQAERMASALQTAVLVTYVGEGHGSYGAKSSCINALVVAYLVNGRVPADQTRCH